VGVDIYGLRPKSEKGEYFRSNWWFWRPIWAFSVLLCEDILEETTMECEDGTVIRYHEASAGLTNDGFVIRAEKALEMGKRILEVLKDEKRFKEVAKKVMDLFADHVDEGGNPLYPLSKEALREWAEFCINSGGFSIC